MNALKHAVPKAQERKIQTEVKRQWSKVRNEEVKRAHDRTAFLIMVSTAMVLDDMGTDEIARSEILKAISEKATEISNFLVSNKCEYGNGHKDFDVEANREYCERWAKEYKISYNEEMFEEVEYD